jgi:hypothetical protein
MLLVTFKRLKTMRSTVLLLASAAVLLSTSVFAQSVEYDDMYFNAKDRQKLRDKQAAEQASFSQAPASRNNKNNATSEVYADASEASSYAARNQNPEFTARANAKKASEDDEYFSSNYKPSTSYANASNLSSFNNSYSNWYNNPWVANNYWGSSIYGWNSSYYGSYYDTWGNPWMNPYYMSSCSASYGFYGGGNPYSYRNMGMGMAMAFSFGNSYNNGWSGMGLSSGYGYGSPYQYGYGGGYGYYGSGYGAGYGYIDNGPTPVYGKRGTQNGIVTRGQAVRNNVPKVVPTTNGTIGNETPTYNRTSGGRMAATSTMSAPSRPAQRQDDYYNRNWRSSRQGDTYGGSSSYSQPSRSSQSGNWNNSSSSQTNQTNWGRTGGFDSGRSSSYSGGNTNSGSSAPASTGTRSRSRD